MNPPLWPRPKPARCPCPDCHLARYVDLAYAVQKGGPVSGEGPTPLTDEPTGDAMRWTPQETA